MILVLSSLRFVYLSTSPASTLAYNAVRRLAYLGPGFCASLAANGCAPATAGTSSSIPSPSCLGDGCLQLLGCCTNRLPCRSDLRLPGLSSRDEAEGLFINSLDKSMRRVLASVAGRRRHTMTWDDFLPLWPAARSRSGGLQVSCFKLMLPARHEVL